MEIKELTNIRPTVSTLTMAPGQLGILRGNTDRCAYEGEYIMCIEGNHANKTHFIRMKDGYRWDYMNRQVYILPVGTKLEITI